MRTEQTSSSTHESPVTPVVESLVAMLAGEWLPRNAHEARQTIAGLGRLARMVDAAQADLIACVRADGLNFDDGHASAKVMVRHVNKLSGAEAANLDRSARMTSDLVDIAAAHRNGDLGTDQFRLLARVWSNPRVRDKMAAKQSWFLSLATKLAFPRFEARVRRWESMVDQDGAAPADEVTHERRNAQLVQNAFDLGWDLAGRFGALDGARMSKILKAYEKAEFEADWAAAKAMHGDDVCTANLARTAAQRRADALAQIFSDAVANPAAAAPAPSVHSIVWSAPAFEEMASRFAGNAPKPFDLDDYRCETSDGVQLDPYEAFANSLVNKIRRVVVDARSVVIDLGQARFFTGYAKDAAHLMFDTCYWPGCWVPASRCETDHLDDHAGGGRTCPGNGAPGCGRHNRWKQKGYRVFRDDSGCIHVLRPDGTEIE